MYKIVFSLAVGLASLSVTPTSAAPIGNLSGLSNDVVQVQHRMICDQRGRCYRAAPRNARRNVVRDDYGYAPQYAPRRSYGYAPGYYDGSPGVGIGIGGVGIGVGPRW
jgi:hypothetical protein